MGRKVGWGREEGRVGKKGRKRRGKSLNLALVLTLLTHCESNHNIIYYPASLLWGGGQRSANCEHNFSLHCQQVVFFTCAQRTVRI